VSALGFFVSDKGMKPSRDSGGSVPIFVSKLRGDTLANLQLPS
jgi:hypothetical protein